MTKVYRTTRKQAIPELVEDIWERDENQRRTTIWRYTYRERCRENHQTGKNRDQKIDERDLQCRFEEIGLSAKIGCVCTDTAHTDTQGIERLS